MLLAGVSRDCALVTAIDGHPATLAWLGGVYGHRCRALGVEHFGQTGTLTDLYRHYRIDVNAILEAAERRGPRQARPPPPDGDVRAVFFSLPPCGGGSGRGACGGSAYAAHPPCPSPQGQGNRIWHASGGLAVATRPLCRGRPCAGPCDSARRRDRQRAGTRPAPTDNFPVRTICDSPAHKGEGTTGRGPSRETRRRPLQMREIKRRSAVPAVPPAPPPFIRVYPTLITPR